PLSRLFWRSDKLGARSCLLRCIDQGVCQTANADQHINFLLAHVTSGLAMQCFTLRAKLEHLAGDHDAARRLHPRESIDHRSERLWIGIVAIVDDGDVTQL